MKSGRRLALVFALSLLPLALYCQSAGAGSSGHQVQNYKVTILSTMLADEGIGEWGFSALLEVDGRQILIDTGARPETVLKNATELKVDLSPVEDVVLTHFHGDHTGGLMSLRTELMKKNPAALSRAHVGRGFFWPRPSAQGERNSMIEIRKQYEKTGGKFVEHEQWSELLPGVWLTGPVPRVTDEKNYGGRGVAKVQTPDGIREDNVPDDQSVIIETKDGLLMITGCGHAGVVNILKYTHVKFPDSPITTLFGGLHLYDASDKQLSWTADQFKLFGVRELVGAHCTGIDALFQLRQRLNLSRKTAVVGAVGATYVSGKGIHPGEIAQ